MDTLTTKLTVNADGSIDQAASTAAFTSALSAYVSERDIEQDRIAEKVSELFDENKGQRIVMPSVASLTAQKLGAVPANFSVLSERVAEYVRANADGKGADLFNIGKGRSQGGVGRKSDLPAKA